MPTSASILQILSFFVVSKAFLGNQKTLSTKVQVADTKVQVADTTSFHINLLEKKREDQLTALRKTEIELATLAEECFVDPNNDDRCSSTTTSLPNILFDNNFGYQSRSEGFPGAQLTSNVVGSNVVGGGGKHLHHSGPPSNILTLAIRQFHINTKAIFGVYEGEAEHKKGLKKETLDLQTLLKTTTLDPEAVWRREATSQEQPLAIKIPYFVLCKFLDLAFPRDKPISRFYYLETVARMPYFSYISMLHLYETLGWWRHSSEVKRVHFDEEYNEFHHLLIMESLGGDQDWSVRFFAQHSAILYYWTLTLLWLISPSLAYGFSVLLEGHAVATYEQFIEENLGILKSLPPPKVAVDYYDSPEYFLSGFAEGVAKKYKKGSGFENLSDVFRAIASDERGE